MTQHGAFSIIANITSGMKAQLVALLQQIVDNDVETNSIIPFKKITSIHFARLLILDAGNDAYGNPLPDRLAFTTNYDNPTENHLHEMISVAGPGLWQIFSMTDNFPKGAFSATTLYNYFLTHNKPAETFYKGIGYRSVQQVHNENQLRNLIEAFADNNAAALKKLPATEIRQKIIDHVFSNPEFAWAKQPDAGPAAAWNFTFYSKLTVVILLFIILLPLIIPFVIIWMLIMLSVEIREKQTANPLTKDHIRALVDRETQIVQAQFSALGNVKPGAFRLATMMFLLRMTDFLAPYLFSKGKLSGIPTVHFARWLIINNGKQMLFLSNYDGNSENYLRDFIHIAAKQLTLMFCHTEGYPKTRFMIFGGAKDAEGFMEWARSKQIITNVWYSANKEVSVRNIFNNGKIRAGLYGRMNEAEARKWLETL
ncbi:hypothetical protein ACTHGU_20395 [Chitinophagaceae bacterium MMS25-I14]